MSKNAVINKVLTRFDNWKVKTRQKQEIQGSGLALAKDMGISYETLMFGVQHPNQDLMPPAAVNKQLRPVVNIRSKLFHKIRTIH